LRKIVLVLLITTIFIIFSIYSVNYLEKSSEELITQLVVVEKAIKQKEWHKAQGELEQFRRNWEKAKFMWSILIDHREIDNIEVSIAHIGSYLSTQNLSEISAEIKGLYLFLKHIPETEKISLENFL